MSLVGRPGRRWIVVVLGLVAVLLGLLWIGQEYRIGGLEAASVAAGILGVLGLVVPFVRWLFKWNSRAATPEVLAASATNLAVDDLAKKVGDRWNRDSRFSDLDRPSPIPVAWSLTTREGAMQRADLVGIKSFDGSSGQVDELVARFKALDRSR